MSDGQPPVTRKLEACATWVAAEGRVKHEESMKLPLIIVTCTALAAAPTDDTWHTYGHLAKRLDAIAPTPTGTGHLGKLESGACVQIRFPLPKTRPAGFWVGLSNIVGYSGRGQSYQLVVRVDTKAGPLVYEGPTVLNGDRWNATNREPISVTKAITAAHLRQAYVDIFASGIVKDDGWTLYRHDPKGRRVTAQVVVLSERETAQIRTTKALAARGLALLPMPQQLTLAKSDFACSSATRVAVPPDASEAVRFAAADLVEAMSGAGLEAPVVATASPDPKRDIILDLQPRSMGKAEGYRIEINAAGARATAADDQGIFYAVQTLRQLVAKAQGKTTLVGATIDDWPAFPIRGFQYDIARGQTVDVEFCKRVIRESAQVKMNAIMFYLEDDYQFEKYPFLGREGTFNKAKATELTSFAERYHVQLIPQYESLGHASAVLRHDEMAKLREKGGSWVFCTSEPGTWQFLDDAYAELTEAFGSSRFIHVGGDEFEGGFAKCERCRTKAAQIGVGGLYAQHMSTLNALVKKRGLRMLFWPSHHGPSDDYCYMSLKNAAAMPKEAIPTEWIYHGPSTYPQIEQYQTAGYRDVWCCPAVVGYSRPYPCYATTFRGIRGFFRAGHERKCQAAMTTTWEFMHGALFENAWMGLIYTGECAWSLGVTSQADFRRRFVHHWFDIVEPKASQGLSDLLHSPLPASGTVAIWRDPKTMRNLLWSQPREARRQFVQKDTVSLERAALVVAASAEAVKALDELLPAAKRNRSTIRFAVAACRMYGYACDKLLALDRVAKNYETAGKTPDQGHAAQSLEQAAITIDGILPQCAELAASFTTAIRRFGGYKGDLTRMETQMAQWQELAKALRALSADLRAGKPTKLPPAQTYGLGRERYIQVGEWTPAMVKERRTALSWQLKDLPKAGQRVSVELEYTRGTHGLRIFRACLVVNGVEVSVDEHTGWAGSGSDGNRYRLDLPALATNAKVELRASTASSGGTDSRGNVWLVLE